MTRDSIGDHTCVWGAQGLSFDAAVRRLEHERKDGDASGFYTSRHKMFGCRPHSPAPHVYEPVSPAS